MASLGNELNSAYSLCRISIVVVAAVVVAPNGARPSADAALATMLHMTLPIFFKQWKKFETGFYMIEDIPQNVTALVAMN